VAPIYNLPDELTLYFIAKPHTAITANALTHVDVDIWMRVIDERSFIYILEVTFFQPVLNCVTIEGLLRRFLKSVAGMILGQHFQYHAPLMLEHWSMSGDDHAVFKYGGAGWNGPRFAVDFNQTQATSANRLQTVVVTERGNMDAYGLRRFEDREGLLKLVGFTIYYRSKQNLIFQKSSAFVSKIVVLFPTDFATIRIVQSGFDRLAGIAIGFVIHVEREPAHTAPNFVLVPFGHKCRWTCFS
jgi:hypothetical protein